MPFGSFPHRLISQSTLDPVSLLSTSSGHYPASLRDASSRTRLRRVPSAFAKSGSKRRKVLSTTGSTTARLPLPLSRITAIVSSRRAWRGSQGKDRGLREEEEEGARDRDPLGRRVLFRLRSLVYTDVQREHGKTAKNSIAFPPGSYAASVRRAQHLLGADQAVKLFSVEQTEGERRLLQSGAFLVRLLCGSCGVVVADPRIETGDLRKVSHSERDNQTSKGATVWKEERQTARKRGEMRNNGEKGASVARTRKGGRLDQGAGKSLYAQA